MGNFLLSFRTLFIGKEWWEVSYLFVLPEIKMRLPWLMRSLTTGMLLLWDRAFVGYELWTDSESRGRFVSCKTLPKPTCPKKTSGRAPRAQHRIHHHKAFASGIG